MAGKGAWQEQGKEGRQRAQNTTAASEGRAVYVRGVPPEWSEADVEALFGEHGALEGVHLLQLRPGQRCRAAFANFAEAGGAERAVRACDGMVVKDAAEKAFWLGCSLKGEVGKKGDFVRAGLEPPSEILDGFLFLGHKGHGSSEAELRRLGISHVLSILPHSDDSLSERSDVERLVLHAEDSVDEDVSALFDRAYDFLETCRAEGGRALVHCVAGRSRSATVAVAYVMRCRRLPLREAFGLVQSRRKTALPNEGFWRQLQAEELRLFGAAAGRPRGSRGARLPRGALERAPGGLLEGLRADLAELSARFGVRAAVVEARDEVWVDGCGERVEAAACLQELQQILAFYGLLQASQKISWLWDSEDGGCCAKAVSSAGTGRLCPKAQRRFHA